MSDADRQYKSLPAILNDDDVPSDGVHRQKHRRFHSPAPPQLEIHSMRSKQTDSSSRDGDRTTSPAPPQALEKDSDKGERDPAGGRVSESSAEAPRPKPCSLLSTAQVTNVRYQRDGGPSQPDHPNEDKIVTDHRDTLRLFAVFDGHDGSNAVQFAADYLKKDGLPQLWLALTSPDCDTDKQFTELFSNMDNAFFTSIKAYTDRKRSIQQKISHCRSSYEAYLQYPVEVSELQELKGLLSGGTTVVLAVIINDRLHIANVGDSRALLVRELNDGNLDLEQLSTDHGVDNDNELARLVAIGLDGEQLRKSGRLGSQENTRSIGDYCLKGGYRDVDALRAAEDPPGMSIPSMYIVEVDESFKYLILMSDGVYKSIESLSYPPDPAKGKEMFYQMLKVAIKNHPRDFHKVASDILEKIKGAHERTYCERDPQSPEAVQCRKRDNMSLVVYQFK